MNKLEKKLKLRLGFGIEETCKRLSISESQLTKMQTKNPELYEVVMMGMSIGTKWIDFQDRLEKYGYIIISSSGVVSYKGSSNGMSQLLKKYGVNSAVDLAAITGVSRQVLYKMFEEERNLFQYIMLGASYIKKFRKVEKAYNETVAKND